MFSVRYGVMKGNRGSELVELSALSFQIIWRRFFHNIWRAWRRHGPVIRSQK
jgi:hypothetical protein